MERHYDARWSEEVELEGEGRLRLRLIRPSDKAHIEAGLLSLSEESQYLRFFTAKPRLTAAELQYFTEVDGFDHFAIGAVRIDADGEEGQGVAVARFVRLPGEPRVAEPAIVVIDELQGKGLGRTLMHHLVEAARERDVDSFRSEFLAVNAPVKALLQGVATDPRFVSDGPVVTAEFPLHALPAEPTLATPAELMRSWLRLVAEKSVELRRRFAMLLDPEQILEAWRRHRR